MKIPTKTEVNELTKNSSDTLINNIPFKYEKKIADISNQIIEAAKLGRYYILVKDDNFEENDILYVMRFFQRYGYSAKPDNLTCFIISWAS